MDRLVVPTLQKTARRLRSVLVERSKRLDHIVMRLEDIRSKQQAMPAPDPRGDEGDGAPHWGRPHLYPGACALTRARPLR